MTDALSRDLLFYLQRARDSLVTSLDGLSEYDIRRPMTATGTNLLGLVKHLTGVEFGYFCDSVGRPAPVTLPWNEDGSVWQNGDMWARPTETRDYIVGLYRQAWHYADESITTLPLDHPVSVPWWPEDKRDTTFGHLLVRLVEETGHHAGHADIVRELLDPTSGRDAGFGDAARWDAYVAEVQAAADTLR